MLICQKASLHANGAAQRSFRYAYSSSDVVGAIGSAAGQHIQKQQQHEQRGVSGQ